MPHGSGRSRSSRIASPELSVGWRSGRQPTPVAPPLCPQAGSGRIFRGPIRPVRPPRIEPMKTTFKVNGKSTTVDVPADMPLLWVLRDELDLKGTKFGCGIAQCGACTVHVNGNATRSCTTPSLDRRTAREITTIEGLSPDGTHALQRAWEELDVPQCGYCQAGQLMSAAALLAKTPKPTDARYRRRDERQPLPLRDVPAHPPGDPSRRRHAQADVGPRQGEPERMTDRDAIMDSHRTRSIAATSCASSALAGGGICSAATSSQFRRVRRMRRRRAQPTSRRTRSSA